MSAATFRVSVAEPGFLKRIERLRVAVRSARGLRPGETPIPRSNQAWGIEFESYKDYAPGDDFRYVDWNAVGRLDQLLVKTFTAEREIPYYIFLDTSASMGAPAIDRKFQFALDLVAALSYLVLLNSDTLRIIALTASGKGQRSYIETPLARHRSAFLRTVSFLETLVPSGKTYLREAVRAYSEQAKEPGVAIVVSDFLMEPAQYEEAFMLLRVRGYEVKALHVVGAAELEPQTLFRRGKLFDVENGAERWITLSQANLQRYQEAQQAHFTALKDFCHRYRIVYNRASTASSISTVLTEELPQAGVLTLR